jgi:hypothetical protein
MRRYAVPLALLFSITATALALSAAPVLPSSQIAITLPGTNTPNRSQIDIDIDFATNTPPGPTATPTATATATFTATPSPTPTPTATLTPSPTATLVGPARYPDGFNSLTGLPYPNEEAMNRRNLLVKISNFPPEVRPQSGLNQADVVWEYEVEGGVTRFAAIFRSNTPSHVGPVRSGRLMDLELVPMYEALFAYSGASEPVQQMFMRAPWAFQILSPSVGDNCEEAGFCRFPREGLAFEHTLYLDTAQAWARAERRQVNQPFRARGFAFSEVRSEGGTPANDMFIDWYGRISARWQYNAATERYLRYTDGVPHFDAADGEQLWADNIVVLEVPHQERGDLFEPESRSASQQINLWDQGRAYVFRDGVYYTGFWRRPCDLQLEETPTPVVGEPQERCYSNMGTALQLVFGNNAPIMLKPGRTYVQVVRFLGDAAISETLADMSATGTSVFLSATPTPIRPSATPGPSPTPSN